MKIENGKEYIFNTTQSDLIRYNGTAVCIVRPLTKDEFDVEEVGNMYRAKFNDGRYWDVFEDELIREKCKHMREDGICLNGASSNGRCKEHCSYYEL